MSSQTWLLLHVLGVVLFLGNIVVTALWKQLGDRTRSPQVVAHAQRLVNVTDAVFTLPGVVLILVSGHVLAADRYGGVFGGPAWLVWGWSLFLASGVIWVAVLLPVQVAQARLARGFRDGGEIPQRYWRLATVWAVAGTVATVLPLVNLYLMTARPG